MMRFILGYVVFGVTTMLYEWNRYFKKDVADETFNYAIKNGDAFKNLDDDNQGKTLFIVSSAITLIFYGLFWPKAIYDAIDEWYHDKED